MLRFVRVKLITQPAWDRASITSTASIAGYGLQPCENLGDVKPQLNDTSPAPSPVDLAFILSVGMRLVFSTNDHPNTNISDERGFIYYSISTPWTSTKRVTTITKYRWSGQNGVPETMGVIEWHRLKETVFRFNGQVIHASVMLEARPWHTGRYFTGPDQRAYKWKLEASHCWMKFAESDTELVRFHQKNLGILKEAHPAYLDVFSNVVPLLDHVILTFVYVESLRQEQMQTRRRNSINNIMNINTINNINTTVMNTSMGM